MPGMEWSATTLVDIVLCITIAEALALWAYHRRTGKGIPTRDLLGNLVSGLMLMAALRAHMAAGPWELTAVLLAASGIAHATDTWRRWRR